jgi:carbamoylphosphate synthase large subunit
VAPCQTLNDAILQECRTAAIRCAEAFNLVGEGNVQFAIHSETGEIRIIEMNPRLSRSSALASKATAYPIAAIAAKIQLGMSLLEIKNENVNSDLQISAFYEPVLDYFAIKMPRWDIQKLPHLTSHLGTAMKSVGEVLSISRNYQQALYNAMKSTGNFTKEELKFNLDEKTAIQYYSENKYTTHRWIAIGSLINNNNGNDHKNNDNDLLNYLDIYIHPYFLQDFTNNNSLSDMDTMTYNNLDSFSGEIPTKSNYRYLTPLYKNYLDSFSSSKLETKNTRVDTNNTRVFQNKKTYKGKVIIIGGSTYRIGSSVEFDWCCVSTARRARELGYYVVMINDNPETVSTDYQECDALYMENPNIENLKAIYKIETELCQKQGIEMLGVIVSMGGQTSNNLVMDCANAGIHILGTQYKQIENAEDRDAFSSLLDKLHIDQPEWINAKNISEVIKFCSNVGYPCLIRPSFVLSGAGMKVIYNENEANEFLKKAQDVSGEHPVVVSKFIENAKEIEVDAIAQDGEIRAMALSEHIEDAGCHSGDAHMISPPVDLTHETLKRVKAIAHTLAIYLEISGPFNLQLLAKDDHLKVIELNLRASRSMPFVSRVYKFNFINLATEIILDSQKLPKTQNFNDKIEMIEVPKYLTSIKTRNLQTIGVKSPQFSFHRFPEIEQNVNVEMMSTGENACFSKNKYKAFLRAISASGFKLPKSPINGSLLLICSSGVKKELEKYLIMFLENKWSITDYISMSSSLNNYRNKFASYDLIFYVRDNYQILDKIEELELNKLRNVVRNKKQIKFLTKAICYCLDKI